MLHHSKITVTLLVTLASFLPAGVFATPVSQQGEFKVSVAGTAAGSIPHDITLKMTQIPGGQLSETTGFAITPESVVQVKQGENIMVTTSENLKVNNVKAKNVQGQQVDLIPLPNNVWSLQNLVPGVYLLDVSADMSSSGILGVYETVLMILQPDQQPLPPTTVINEVSIIIEDGPPLPPPDETYPSPEPLPPCPPEAQENGVCPPTDDITPVPEPPTPCPPDAPESEVCPPTDEITPVPGPPPPDCPEAGPEVCGEESPEEPPPGSNGNGDGNGNGDEDGSGGEDGSNGDGENGGDSNDNNGNGGTSNGGGELFE